MCAKYYHYSHATAPLVPVHNLADTRGPRITRVLLPARRLTRLRSTSPASAAALLATAPLPPTQVFFYPGTLPYAKANQPHASWKTCSSPLATCSCPRCRNQRPNPRQTRGAAPPGFAPFPREAVPAAQRRWPSWLSHVPGSSRGLLSSPLPASCAGGAPRSRLLRQLLPPAPSQQLRA